VNAARATGLVRKSPLRPLLANVADSGLQFVAHTLWLHRSQWYPPVRLRRFQEQSLRRLVAHAYAQSPHYREVLDSCGLTPARVGTLADLVAVPVLRRQTVADRLDRLVARGAEAFRPAKSHTSGTTGTRLELLRDRRTTSVGNAARWRFRGWHGIGFHHRIAEFRGIYGPSGEIDRTAVVRYHPSGRSVRVNLAMLNRERLAPVAAELTRFKPDAISTSSPSALALLGMFLLDRHEFSVRPKVVFTGGERLFPDQRTVIAEAFQAPVVDMYANWEYAVFAGECPAGRSHLAAEMGITEVLRNGRPCAPGEPGEVVITNLWNRSLPFIRYAIGDMGALEADPCPCGRGLPTWRIMGGRERDLLATRAGFMFLPVSILALPHWRDKISGVRFYQETRNDVLVQIVKGPQFTEADLPRLREELNRHLGQFLDVSIEFCDHIEQTAGGKYRYVMSKVPLDV
jgi:phenylacetate-CoA ligase